MLVGGGANVALPLLALLLVALVEDGELLFLEAVEDVEELFVELFLVLFLHFVVPCSAHNRYLSGRPAEAPWQAEPYPPGKLHPAATE